MLTLLVATLMTVQDAPAAQTDAAAPAPTLQALTAPEPRTLNSGEVVEGRCSEGAPAPFGFVAPGPGVLSLVLRDTGRADLMITIYREDGEVAMTLDDDQFGDLGAEQGFYEVASPQTLGVEVSSNDGRGRFVLGVHFTPTDRAIPNATQIQSEPLQIDNEVVLSFTRRDRERWFTHTPERSELLVLATRKSGDEEPDIRIEVYDSEEFINPIQTADRDLGGVVTDEALLVYAEAGKPLFVKVLALTDSSRAQNVAFRAELANRPSAP
jgi:hypothetical protein